MHRAKECAEKYDKRLERLGIKYNPFPLRCPEEPVLQKLFMNRDKEIENTIGVIEGRRNALIYGYYGVGKTAFLKYFLFDLAGLEKPKVASIYTTFTGASEIDFLNTIAFALAKQFKSEYKRAEEVYNKMSGLEKGKELTTGMEAGFSMIFKGAGKYASTEGETFKAALLPAYTKDFVMETLKTMSEKYRILIGVDEIDKIAPRDFNKLIAGIRDILGYNASFMLTGSYTFLSLAGTIISTQYGAFDIKTELPEMSVKDLKDASIKYCKAAGGQPFTEDALEALAEQSLGIPRAMMVICRGAVENAASAGLNKIDRKNISTVLFATGKAIYASLLTTQKKVVRYLMSTGGELDTVTKKVAADLGVTQPRVYTYLDALMSKDAIIEMGKNGERIWKLSPALVSYLKKEGKK